MYYVVQNKQYKVLLYLDTAKVVQEGFVTQVWERTVDLGDWRSRRSVLPVRVQVVEIFYILLPVVSTVSLTVLRLQSGMYEKYSVPARLH